MLQAPNCSLFAWMPELLGSDSVQIARNSSLLAHKPEQFTREPELLASNSEQFAPASELFARRSKKPGSKIFLCVLSGREGVIPVVKEFTLCPLSDE